MVKVKNKCFALTLVVFLIIGLVGSIDTDTGKAASKKIHLQKTKVTLISGKTFQQKLINKNGKTIKATKVKWKSSKKAVATINKKGKVTSKKAGKAKVTAKYKGKTYKFNVVVKKPFKAGEAPKISTIEQHTSPYSVNNTYIYVAWSHLKNAARYQVYLAVNGGNYKLFKEINPNTEGGRSVVLGDLTDGNKYSFKVRAVMGQYKSAFSSAKTIKANKGPSHYASWLKDYILREGTQVESDHSLAALGGDKCIKSYGEWGVDGNGQDVRDVYIISACNNNNLLTFGLYREIYDGYKESHKGYNTKESTCVLYNPDKDECYVNFNQHYYWRSQWQGRWIDAGSFQDYNLKGTLIRSKYLGIGAYGLENITLDSGEEATITNKLTEGVEKTMIGTEELLKDKYTEITMKNLGFKRL